MVAPARTWLIAGLPTLPARCRPGWRGRPCSDSGARSSPPAVPREPRFRSQRDASEFLSGPGPGAEWQRAPESPRRLCVLVEVSGRQPGGARRLGHRAFHPLRLVVRPLVGRLRLEAGGGSTCASISGELSTPVRSAAGQRLRRYAVMSPMPQPRSATLRGRSRGTRASSSRAGRSLWSEKARYWWGSHVAWPMTPRTVSGCRIAWLGSPNARSWAGATGSSMSAAAPSRSRQTRLPSRSIGYRHCSEAATVAASRQSRTR
jgi:hypothetical protein